jgi:small-conductance mechanosensitive channel
VPLHVYAGTGLAGNSELFIPRGCFMNNIIYIVGVIVIVIAVLSFFGLR